MGGRRGAPLHAGRRGPVDLGGNGIRVDGLRGHFRLLPRDAGVQQLAAVQHPVRGPRPHRWPEHVRPAAHAPAACPAW